MTYYFKNYFIKNNELLFYIFIISMIVIIALTIYWVIKEIKKNENK